MKLDEYIRGIVEALGRGVESEDYAVERLVVEINIIDGDVYPYASTGAPRVVVTLVREEAKEALYGDLS